MTMGIYGIHNTTSDQWYCGQSVNIEQRWHCHIWKLENKSYMGNSHLSAAWHKYGKSSFEFIVLEEVLNVKLLTAREEFWIAEKRATSKGVYNQRVAVDSNRGMKLPAASVERRAKISVANTGKICSLKTREKLSNLNRGKKLSLETRLKISASSKGKKNSPMTRAKLSAANMGKKASLETRAKQSAVKKGNKEVIAHCARLSAANRLFGIEEVAKIHKLCAQGYNHVSIAAIMQCSRKTIWNVINGRHGYFSSLKGVNNG